MPVWSLLLRMLVCLLLTLNGVATAAASVHMPAGIVETSAATVATTDRAMEMPCHLHGKASADDPGSHASDVAKAPDSKTGKKSPSDCCKSGLCRCACVQGAQAALMEWPVAAPVIEHGLNVARLPEGHRTPALPHLIRPPIG